MDIPEHRRWMTNRLLPSRSGFTYEFLNGVEEFDALAQSQKEYKSWGKYRCPCVKCQNRKFLTPGDVKVHLYKRGFTYGYWYWILHGEEEPEEFNPTTQAHHHDTSSGGEDYENKYETMVNDVFEANIAVQYEGNMNEAPNESAQAFYDMLHAAQQPLWPGSTSETELSAAVNLMSIKSDYNMAQNCFNDLMGWLHGAFPDNLAPKDFNAAKKIVSKLGLKAQKIDCCQNGCMLYYKDDIHRNECKFCHHPRCHIRVVRGGKSKKTPFKRMHYLPLIPRLQRLYASKNSAQHMRWHAENARELGVLCHPSDGEAWKHFDRIYPDFAMEPRNVRLGLCADGFTPYSLTSQSYSCWPVIVVPYNLPPEMCMTTPYMFLTCIIPGPKNPTNKIDVFLQPLIDELKLLWEGVLTYDIERKQNFVMRATLMWTINDFPAYGMLSGWSTHGKLACPICMFQGKGFRLQNGGKPSWFDNHRRFLPMDHPFRRNKDAFLRNKIETSCPPISLSGEQLCEMVSSLPKVTDKYSFSIDGFGDSHNFTKKSIFWELPYWKDNLLRHNLDVMHIEKNFFDNIFNTVMDIKGKTKDNLKARMDIQLYCRRKELELKQHSNGKIVKPKAKYCFTMEQRRTVCQWVKELKFPDGYASNLSRCADVREGKLSGMKSHDCHVFMESLLPTAFNALPAQVWKPITELSLFFKDLCSSTLWVDNLLQMERNIVIILCRLERIFPPGFFDVMEHLPVHLALEARLGGPVQYRWMYPFERFLGKLKRMVKNKARVEGSICEAYLCQETSQFCSFYFESHVPSMRTRRKRNDDAEGDDTLEQPTLSIFQQIGRLPKRKPKKRYLTGREYSAAHLHILLNCEEVTPYINYFSNVKRTENPNISEDSIDAIIENEFASWFEQNIRLMGSTSPTQHQHLCDLAMGPLNEVTTWHMYFVNGYKFHTDEWCSGKKTINSGVCVKGAGAGGIANDYYGVLKEVIELEYVGESNKKCILFNCHWFDPTPNRGVKVHNEYGIVEVLHTRSYRKFDPFIFPNVATQVYYMPYPQKGREKSDWWVVVRTKPRFRVDDQYSLPIAFQEEEMHGVNNMTEDVPIENLVDNEDIFEEHDISAILQNNDVGEDDECEDDNDDDEDEDEDRGTEDEDENEENDQDRVEDVEQEDEDTNTDTD